MILHAKDPRIRHLEIIANRLVQDILAGNYRSVFRGRGIEFDEAREYVDGDDSRLIDWNVTSRMGAPYTKTYREERELTLFFIVDVSSSLYYSGGDTKLFQLSSSIITLIALAAQINNDKIGAALFSENIEKWYPPRKDRQIIFRILWDMLKLQNRFKGSCLDKALRTVNKNIKRRSICIILSDFRMEGYEKDLALLSKKHDIIAIRLSDSLEKHFHRIGTLTVEDPETGQDLLLFSNNRSFRLSMKEYWEKQTTQWMRMCHSHGISPVQVTSDMDPVRVLIDYFHHRRAHVR